MLGTEGLREHSLAGEPNIIDVKVSVARPGQRVRIVNIIDVIQPISAGDGGHLFPGFLAPPVAITDGVMNRLEGVAIVTAAKRDAASPLFAPKQAIVDMAGPGTDYSPFSRMHVIVLEPVLKPDLSDREWDHAMRSLGLKAASYLARATTNQDPEMHRVRQLPPTSDDLPKLVAIIQLGGEGPLHDNYVYGRRITGIFPTYLHPNEFYSGAVVGGNYTYACQRNFTYIYQNSSLLDHLYEGHGATHTFLGTIITRGFNQTHADKTMAANFAAKLARQMGADGAILTADGAGNGHTDVMFTCEQCEQLDIKTVLQLNEIAGEAGDDPGLVDFVASADAMVSVGNRDQLVHVESMPTIAGFLPSSDEQLFIPVRDFCGSTNETGQWNLGCDEN